MSNARDKANIPALNFSSTGIDDNATSTAITIDSSERVGINETSPASLLHVTSSTSDNRIQLTNSSSSDGSVNSGASIQLNGTSLIVNNNEASGDIFFRTDGFTERMRINNVGNVGIGTSSPASLLHISGTSPQMSFTETDQSNKQYRIGSFGSAYAVYDVSNGQYRYTLDTNGNHIFNEGGLDCDFRVESNNNANMLFVDGGNDRVGIGTSSPSAVLDVRDETNGANFIVGGSGTTNITKIGGGAGDSLQLFTNSTTPVMLLSTSGNIGIGTTSPDSILDLTSTPNNNFIHFNATTGGSNGNIIGGFEVNNTGGTIGKLTVHRETTNSSGYMAFQTGTTEKMRINNSGSVGIGTSSPGTVPLNVVTTDGGNVDDILEIRNNSTTSGTGARLRFVSSTDPSSVPNSVSISSYRNAGSDHDMLFESSGSEKMRIRSTGLVGIGTTSPTSTLEISKSDRDNGCTLSITNAHTGTDWQAGDIIGTINFRTNDTSTSQPIRGQIVSFDDGSGAGSAAPNDSAMKFSTASSNTLSERMRIDSSGNVLIGTTSVPNSSEANNSLCVAPTLANSSQTLMQMENNLNTTATSKSYIDIYNGNGTQVGSISANQSATQYNTSSDYRLKENVSYDFDATTRLKQLKPARFNFIADADTTVDGFIAHEVLSVVPEAISGEKDAMKTEEYEVTPAVLDENGNVITEAVMGTREVPDYQGIDQSKLVPLLVKTIQELEARITALETNNP